MHWSWFMWRVFRPSGKKLRPLESKVLDLFLDRLDPVARAAVAAQVANLGFLHRSARDRAVHFVHRDKNVELIGNRTEGMAVCSVRFSNAGKDSRCDIYFDGGYLCDIIFSASPAGRSLEAFRSDSVDIHADLSAPEPAFVDGAAVIPRTKHLARLAEHMAVENVLPPATSAQIEAFVRRFDCPVPADLPELLAETNGFTVGPWEFRGTRTLVFAWPDRNVHLLASDGPYAMVALCLDEKETRPVYWGLEQSGHSFFNESNSVVESLITLFTREPSEFDVADCLAAKERGETRDWMRLSERL